MRRRPEAYHETLREHEAHGQASGGTSSQANGPASIHEIVMTKEPDLAARLHYDPFERRSGLVRFLAPDTEPTAWADGTAGELSDAVEGAFEVVSVADGQLVAVRDATVAWVGHEAAVRVTKRIVIGGDRPSPTLRLEVTVENRSAIPIDARLGLEWTLTMLGGGANPAAWIELDGSRDSHDSRGTASGVTSIGQGNDYIGITVGSTLTEPADVWWAPVETISNSEAGFERVYQGAGFLFSWLVALGAGESRTVGVTHAVTTTRDRAADEAVVPIPAGVPAAR